MEKELCFFVPGETGIVKKISASGHVKRHLLDMGITPGTEILLRKFAPMGDPVELTVRGYELSIRKEEAKMIMMETRDGVEKA